MRDPANRQKLERFMEALGTSVTSPGRIYFTGGATALWFGWREMTVDIDLKADPEPGSFFESISHLKNDLRVNLELASPDQFIPELPGWRERSIFIKRVSLLDFYHFDPYSQALAKLERKHTRDLIDVRSMVREQLIVKEQLLDFFDKIQPDLIRFPAIEADAFKRTVERFCEECDS